MNIANHLKNAEIETENLNKFSAQFHRDEPDLSIFLFDAEVVLDGETEYFPRVVAKYQSTFILNICVFAGTNWESLAKWIITLLDEEISNA